MKTSLRSRLWSELARGVSAACQVRPDRHKQPLQRPLHREEVLSCRSRRSPGQSVSSGRSRLVSFALVAVLAGCGSSYKASGVFAVKNGMTKQQVRSVAGTPYRPGPACWLYHVSKPGTTIDGMRFCFTGGRVSLIQTAQHL